MAAPMAMSKIERIKKKLEDSIRSGRYYEASQQAKTVYYRYKAQKKSNEAKQMLYDSSLLFLEHEQHESGIDLARLLVSYLKDEKTAIEPNELEMFVTIMRKLKRFSSASCQDFIKECLGLTVPQYKHGHPMLHLAIAIKYWEDGNFAEARHHFLYASDGVVFASFLVECQVNQGFPGEVDLFVVQAILQILCLKNTAIANVVFISYTKNHPAIQKQSWPFPYPLLNFMAFLLTALEGKSLQQFNVLRKHYKRSLERDPFYVEYLDKIGEVFFDIQPQVAPQPGIQGILGGLMETLLTGDQDTEIGQLSSEDVD